MADCLDRAGACGDHARLYDARRDAARHRRSAPLRRTEASGRMSEALLQVEGLEFVYHTSEGPLPALHDLSLSVRAGEILGIVGESGCGKSTLGTALMGLLPPNGEITAGKITYKGHDLHRLN